MHFVSYVPFPVIVYTALRLDTKWWANLADQIDIEAMEPGLDALCIGTDVRNLRNHLGRSISALGTGLMRSLSNLAVAAEDTEASGNEPEERTLQNVPRLNWEEVRAAM